MHNRARLVVGSFLTKDLHIDWREGERHFARLLLDGEPAQNNGNWQWIASTGADPAPYFRRLFNPMTQQRKFDPDGAYVRRWVPELRDVPDGALAEPWTMSDEEQAAAGCVIGEDYPAPIVDHAHEREVAKARYGAAAGTMSRPRHPVQCGAMDELAAYERRFRRAGLPLLIEDYSASEDIFTRVAPLLAFIAFLEVFGAVDLSWPWWANVATVLGALAVLLGALALRNRARGRPALAIPERVGPVELAIFVLVPALLPRDLQPAGHERARHRGGQHHHPARRVGRRRLRPAVDRPLGGRAAGDAAGRVDPARRARRAVVDALRGRPVPDDRDVAGLRRDGRSRR